MTSRRRNKKNVQSSAKSPVRAKKVTEEDKKEIEELKTSTDQQINESEITPEPLSPVEEEKYDKAVNDGELLRYRDYLKDINKNLNALLEKTRKRRAK